MNNLIEKLKNFNGFLLDLIFPKECLNCGKETDYLCRKCFEGIKLASRFYCALCHRESELAQICPPCKSKSALQAIWVAADYNNPVLQDLIHCFKYNYLEDSGRILANLLKKYLEENKILAKFALNPGNTLLVPVPLHPKRYLKRGFNQSEILANHLSEFYNIPVSRLLRRTKNTHSQVDLKRAERQANMAGAFAPDSERAFLPNKKIVLIDDVVTTGSTLNECARVLRENGFKEVYGLVAAQRED